MNSPTTKRLISHTAMTDYLTIMERADRHYHDPAQFHLTEYGLRTDGGDDAS